VKIQTIIVRMAKKLRLMTMCHLTIWSSPHFRRIVFNPNESI